MIVLLAGTGALLAGGATRSATAEPRSAAQPPPTGIHSAANNTARRPVTTRRHGGTFRASGRRHTAIPILMYHVIGDPPSGATHPELYVDPGEFAGQMAWIDDHGYSAVTLRAVWDHWQGRKPLPERPLVITFDDGTRSIARRALPELAARGWVAVLNLDLSNLRPSWGIRPAQVRRLVDAGWEVASHSLTHADLTGLDSAGLAREVAGSRAEIRRLFDVTPAFFCYPSGRFDDRVVAAVEEAGYLGATTTIDGLARPGDRFRLSRVRIDRSDGIRGLADKLTALANASGG